MKAVGAINDVAMAANRAADVFAAINRIDDAVDVIRATDKVSLAASTGFKSFDDLKRVIGPAGEGRAWHHIVEQTPANIEKFGAEMIHSVGNVVSIPAGKGSLHAKISAYYSSKQYFTGGKTVREWLSTKSYEEQYEFGVRVINCFGAGHPLSWE